MPPCEGSIRGKRGSRGGLVQDAAGVSRQRRGVVGVSFDGQLNTRFRQRAPHFEDGKRQPAEDRGQDDDEGDDHRFSRAR